MYNIGCSPDYFYQVNDDKVIEIPQDKGKGKTQWMILQLEEKAPNNQHLTHIWKKGEKESVVMAICRFLYANALPLTLLKVHYFAPMMEAWLRLDLC